MVAILQDIRLGLRTLAKSPGVTAIAVIALALGIGANTSIFTSVNAMVMHPFPFKDLDRLVFVSETAPQQNQFHVAVAPANLRDWMDESQSYEQLTAFRGWDVNLTGDGVAERLEAFQVTAGYFPLLGMAPELGRSISAADFGGHHPVIVLSHGFWRRHMAADPKVVGRNVRLNGETYTIVGVMPDDFDYPVGADGWAPLDLDVRAQADRADHYLRVIGRLKPGVSPARAQDDLERIAARLGREFPQTNAGHGVKVVTLVDDLTEGSKQFLSVLMGAALFVLLLACANVANLQLARATGRQKEIAVRLALGAGRWRITRQMLVESVIVALAGAWAGVLLAAWGNALIVHSLPPFIVQHVVGIKHLQVDSRVLAFTLTVAVLAGLLAGLAPALQLSRPDLNSTLKEGVRGGGSSRARGRLRSLLVVIQTALALVLLVGAGLMVKGFRNLIDNYPGFDRDRVLTFRITLPDSKYGTASLRRDFYSQVVEKLRALPGVEAAAVATTLPSLFYGSNQTEYTAEGQPPPAPGELRIALSQSIGPDFFRALRVPLVEGRFLSARDGADAPPVVVVSEGLARRAWPEESPVGKHIRFGGQDSHEPWCTVVGVVGDVKESPFDHNPSLTAYQPFAQMPQSTMSFAVRTSGDPLAMVAPVRTAIQSVDPNQPAYDMRSLAQLISDEVSGVDSSAKMMTVFGIVALVLAASGIFALMAYSVTQRTHEIGVRMALGARHADVMRLLVGYAFKLAIVGLGVGVPCAVALSRLLEGVLFGVVRGDTLTLAAFTVLLAMVSVLAGYLPARWAARVDPMVALHHE